MPRPAPSGEDWDRDRAEAMFGSWLIPVRWEREEVMGALMPFRMTEITGAACGEREPLIVGGPIEGLTRDATHDLDGHPPESLDWWDGGPGTEAQQAIYAQRQAEKAKRDWTLQAVWEYQQEREAELAMEKGAQRAEIDRAHDLALNAEARLRAPAPPPQPRDVVISPEIQAKVRTCPECGSSWILDSGHGGKRCKDWYPHGTAGCPGLVRTEEPEDTSV